MWVCWWLSEGWNKPTAQWGAREFISLTQSESSWCVHVMFCRGGGASSCPRTRLFTAKSVGLSFIKRSANSEGVFWSFRKLFEGYIAKNFHLHTCCFSMVQVFLIPLTYRYVTWEPSLGVRYWSDFFLLTHPPCSVLFCSFILPDKCLRKTYDWFCGITRC